MLRSSRAVPNPVRFGGVTIGPPLSRHSSTQSPLSDIFQLMVSLAPVVESDPYFAALVASSWRTSAMTENDRVSSHRLGPSKKIALPLPRYGVSSAFRRSTSMPPPSPR